jgi:tetratricopeptide (TPR) repeat protein
MQKAMTAFEAEDYAAADRQAQSVLARDPGHAAAQHLRDRAHAAAAAVDGGLKRARALFDEGKFEEASRAAGEVLSVAPGNAEAKRIMADGAARSRGRGAEEARAQVTRAKAAARAAAAQRLAPSAYAAAITAEREAERLYQGERPGDATVKFYEASGLFRSAEIAAQNEATAREALARAAPPPPQRTEKPAATEPVRPPDAAVAPSSQPTSSSPTPERPQPVPAPATPPPAPLTLPAAPPPAPPAPVTDAPARTPSPETGVMELLGRYKSALEARDMDALQRVWPSLGGAPQMAIRGEFSRASHIAVEIIDPRIVLSGNGGTVTFLRRYVVTVDGQNLRNEARATMEVRRSGSGWVIEHIRFEPVR